MTTALRLPQTTACVAATSIAQRYSSAALANHCMRSFAFASAHARRARIPHDTEILYVAAMLHDLGLTPTFDSHTTCFESAAGELAWVFAAGAGWLDHRRNKMGAAIVHHMGGIDVDLDPEGHLLAFGTAVDISGDHNPLDLISSP